MSAVNRQRVAKAFDQSVSDGKAIARTIQEVADDLAFLMGQLHGEVFKAVVSHEPALVLARWANMDTPS
ncbi:hypothetical protein F9K85_01560 [Brucella tritici]|uniref:hypothetical protein n=1 Tax=Brucella tritici TaxID=94626 RepID=UPI00124BE06F|nr:hypothetical protein [Brucella tritici]KAB2679633.1 hypothetical protein F9K85_01560 [Brucella tritici]